MRDLRNFEDAARENQMETLSLASVGYLWNEWEIHCLILASLALQVLLFFTAGLRKRSTSGVLSTVLWLAYLSSDYVAIFVLGHLAVHASGLQHELLLFWAPFLLVHLGGQDTITALSVQDNELWTRHLLGFISQVAVAGYVVSKSCWPDKQLLAATVLVFLNGSFKYAGRTYCLYSARPANLRVDNLRILSNTLLKLKLAAQQLQGPSNPDSYRGTSRNDALELLGAKFDLMLGKRNEMSSFLTDEDATEIMSADAPLNETESVLVADDLPTLLGKFESTPGPRGPYEYVGGKLAKCYERFYTKRPLLDFCEAGVLIIFMDHRGFIFPNWYYWMSILWLIATLFQYLSTPIALVLFILSEKGHQVHSRTDVIVSYILLVGAIILDVSSASISILSSARSNFFRGRNRINNAILPVANYIQPAWSRKQWAEKLAQYSMVKRYTLEDTVWQRIHKCLAAWGVELWDPSLTHTQVTEDLKGFVLNNLILFGISRQYNFANFRGQLALQKWRHNGPGTAGLYYSINGVKDFPTSVLIWHIATDICYYSANSSTTSIDPDKSKKKLMSRELSNYILYLVFKCGVMLTSNSQLVYNKVHDEMEKILADQQPQMVNLGEKEAAMKVFEGTKHEHPTSMVNEKQKQSVDTDNATSSHLKKLLNSTAEAIYSPVLPHASKVAQELMGIDEEANRWDLIAAVWSEMLYYTAPRCGGAFHYQHLNTGGEFITHVLLLMRSLGPFLPGHDSSTP